MATEELSQIRDLLNYDITSNDIVIFDIDQVILKPAISWLWDENFLLEICQESQSHFIKLKTLRSRCRHYRLVEKNFLSILKQIHRIGAMAIALTARRDIDPFLWEFFTQNNIAFSLQEIEDFEILKDSDITFKAGVIFCNTKDKGEILLNFFKKTDIRLDFNPHPKIFFVDDQKSNCHQVMKSCFQKNILAYTLHYTYHEHLDNECALFQYNYWRRHGILITDSYAKHLIERQIQEATTQSLSTAEVPATQIREEQIQASTTDKCCITS